MGRPDNEEITIVDIIRYPDIERSFDDFLHDRR